MTNDDSESLDVETSYYMVRVRGKGAPMKSHLNEADARAEAERLCAQEKRPAWVLRAVAVVRPKDVPIEWTELPRP